MTTEQQIAKTNFAQAVDQQNAYPSLVKAFEAYYENAWDTAVDNQVSPGEVTDIYEDMIKDAGFAAELDAMWRN